ncbi:hypothetical protein HQN89_03960 [Paenibacillus frigoriresistens]|nr:hypothetical protein [Paenibacillus frigoriresistens]
MIHRKVYTQVPPKALATVTDQHDLPPTKQYWN